MQIVIPAAGASSRMRGRDKLAEQIDGEPLLRRTLRRACATGCPVILTLRQSDPRRALIADLGVEIREVPDAAQGLSASLRRAALGEGSLMVLPADMPDLTTEDLRAMMTHHQMHPQTILRATDHDGSPGHPVIFPADLRGEFAALRGDEGARTLLRTHAHRLAFFPLPGTHATTDLDTPEAWAAWRASYSGAG